MNGIRPIIKPLAVILGLFLVFELLAPTPVNWQYQLKASSKDPYGLYVLYRSLPDLFPEKKISHFNKDFYFLHQEKKADSTVLIIINESLSADKTSINELLKYIQKGHTVFYSSLHVNSFLLDTLHIRQSIRISGTMKRYRPDFKKPLYSPLDSIYFSSAIGRNFHVLDSAAYRRKTLTFLNTVLPDLVQVNIGKGRLYLHSSPEVFTNYYLLNGRTRRYAEDLLSLLPQRNILWYEGNTYNEKKALLSAFLSNRQFMSAYLLLLSLALIFVATEIWRSQRVIPLIPKLKNTSLVLVDSLVQLYFHHKNNRSIADKMLRHFADEIKSRYHLNINDLNKDNLERLRRKAGRSEEEINRLSMLLRYAGQNRQLSNEQVLDLYHCIEKFKTKQDVSTGKQN